MGNLDFLLRNAHFKTYLNNAYNPEEVLDRWDKTLDMNKVRLLQKIFPKTFDEDEIYSSLILNLTADYNKIINRLPKGFSVVEPIEQDSFIHVGSTNQIDIYFNEVLSKGRFEPGIFKVACMSFYFLDSKKGKEIRIENIQGEISTASGYFSDKEIKRVFGKLNAFYGVNWKQGLLQQVYDYGKEQDMNVKGELPGIFYLPCASVPNSMPEYPLYTSDNMTAYLNIGIPLDDIIIGSVPKDIETRWERTFAFLRTRPDEEKVSLIRQAANTYRKEFTSNRNNLHEQKLTPSTFEENCRKAFEQVFSEVFL
jgi:hypothetical protein